MRPNQGVLGNVSPAAEHNVTQLELVLGKSINIRLGDSRNPFLDNPSIANICWHHYGNAVRFVV